MDAGGSQCPDIPTVLALHNQVRARHLSPPLIWSAELATQSQALAESLARRGCVLEHSDDWSVGENLFLQYGGWGEAPPQDCATAVTSWASQEATYNFNTPTPFTTNWRDDNDIGHFTQVVWKATSLVGCGAADGTVPDDPNWRCRIVACQYREPGNVSDDQFFADNVLPPIG